MKRDETLWPNFSHRGWRIAQTVMLVALVTLIVWNVVNYGG